MEANPTEAGPKLFGYLRATTFQAGVLLHLRSTSKVLSFVDSWKNAAKLDRIRSDLRDSRPETLDSPEGDDSAKPPRLESC
jgi:hypothetical protein